MLLSTPRRWCAGGAGPPAVAGAGRRAPVPPARAMQNQSSPAATPNKQQQPREHLRVLRYPNGDERVIRYPAYVAEDAGGARPSPSAASAASAATATTTTTTARAAPAAGSGDSGSSGMGGGVASASLDDYLSWDVTGLWSSSSARPEAPSGGGGGGGGSSIEQRDEEEQQDQQPQEEDEAPSSSAAADRRRSKQQQQSDADYLESLFAAAYAQRPAMPKGMSSRPTTQAAPGASDGTASPSPLPAGTYQVLTGCPWPVPRPLYTLALRHSASAAAAALASRLHPPQQDDDGNAAASTSPDEDRVGSTYTLSVRTRDHGAADDLARALGKGRDWAARMDVGSRRDGVVAFASERDARRFAELLEAPADGDQPGGGHSGVAVARVDSHALFRAADDVKSVVVYLPPCTKGGAEGAAGEATTSASDDDGDAAAACGRMPRPHELAAALLRE